MSNVIDFEEAKAARMVPVNSDKVEAIGGQVYLTFYRDNGEPGVALVYTPAMARLLGEMLKVFAETAENQAHAIKMGWPLEPEGEMPF